MVYVCFILCMYALVYVGIDMCVDFHVCLWIFVKDGRVKEEKVEIE